MIKIDLNSNEYFSTTNANNSANRTFAYDSSIFEPNKKYLMKWAHLIKEPIGFFYQGLNLISFYFIKAAFLMK